MKPSLPRLMLWFLIRVMIGGIFAYAGWTKLTEPIENFRGVIAEYHVIPYAWISWIAAVLPWAEFLAGIFLILGFLTRFSAAVISGLSFGFVLLIAAVVIKTGVFPADCGCFGEGSLVHFSGAQIMVLDSLITLSALYLALLPKHFGTLEGLLVRKPEAPSR